MGVRKERYTCEDVIHALRETKGMVYLAAKVLGCSHTTVYNYINRHPSVKQAFEAESGWVGDTAETKLFDGIENGEPWAIRFYLSMKGSDRGYASTQRQEISGPDRGPVRLYLPEVDGG